MLKRIMVPVDGSVESERALPYAQSLAKANDAEILLVHSIDLPIMMNEEYEGGQAWAETLDMMTDTAQANLTATATRLRSAGIKTSAARLMGSAAPALLDFEKAEQPDMVVMATHGRMGFARFALGSVADRMVRHGVAPVLLVRNGNEDGPLGSALIMLDGSGLAEESLKVLNELVGHPVRRVKLFRAVGDSGNEKAAMSYLTGVASLLSKDSLEVETATAVGDPALLIDRAAQDVDFVILTTHGRGGLDRLRHGSVADRVVAESKKPVLLMRAGLLPVKPSA